MTRLTRVRESLWSTRFRGRTTAIGVAFTLVAGVAVNAAPYALAAPSTGESLLASYRTPICPAGEQALQPIQISVTAHGALHYVYRAGVGTIEAIVPPAGFKPLEANDDTLTEMGMQKPTDPAGLSTWTAEMAQYKGAAPAEYCIGDSPHSLALHASVAADTIHRSTTADPIYAHKGSGNWAGNEWNRSSGWSSIVSHWTQNGAAACGCTSPQEATWVGLGGDPGGLIQAGTTDNAGTTNQAWGEYVTPCGTINPAFNGTVATNDDIAAAVSWNTSTASGTMQVADHGTLLVNLSYHPSLGASCINNAVGEIIDERVVAYYDSSQNPVYYPLTNFATTNFSSARLTVGSTQYGISQLSGTALIMTNDDSSGTGSCASDVIAFPTSNSLSNGEAVKWCRVG